MKPFWTAKLAYDACEPPMPFLDVVDAHVGQGYCISLPDYFICARPVIKEADEALLLDPHYEFDLQHCNAWFVYIAAGDGLPSLWTRMPHDLPYIVFYRLNSNRLRVTTTKRLQEIATWAKEQNNQKHPHR